MLGKVNDDTRRRGGVDRASGRVVDGARRAGPSAARRSTRSGSARILRLFFIGLANLRRPLSLRNLDLLALLSFSISLRVFNEGEIFGALRSPIRR